MAWESRNHGGRPKWARCFDVETSWETVSVWAFAERERAANGITGWLLACR